ncbi:MAG: cyclic pyranopterin monophosphate synthase MoaC [Pyrinomonadaceae bacterium]
MKELSHFDEQGKIRMVDISGKKSTKRIASASAKVLLSAATLRTLKQHLNPKGDPLEIARIAGIMAAKKTQELIPLCHQIDLSNAKVETKLTDFGVSITSEVVTTSQTGVEMEALTAVSVAALTIYDMCKAVQKDIQITDIRLETKTGGKKDYQRR